MPPQGWADALALSELAAATEAPGGGPHVLARFADSLCSDSSAWRDYAELEAPEAAVPPGEYSGGGRISRSCRRWLLDGALLPALNLTAAGCRDSHLLVRAWTWLTDGIAYLYLDLQACPSLSACSCCAACARTE